MLFNSISFLIFLPVVFVLFWSFRTSLKKQNLLLLVSSYIFYGWWDYRFLSLLALSTLIDFAIGIALEKQSDQVKRKLLLIVSVLSNLGILAFFKYFNFFITNWQQAWESVGITTNLISLNILLPVGISFYTFQTLSYTIDVYRRNIKATSNILNFGTFVAFFPQLVAGPIERAVNLLPQFTVKKYFDETKAISGVNLILWGFFKKIVIADNCAIYVNSIFDNYENVNSATLILGALYFAFQIYADFSGYTDIAIGVARLLGFDLMRNFNYPYFSRNIGEFWRRWHISLSTWFRDYVYIPLGGSRGNRLSRIRNISIVFLLSGFWHGANWTFIIWGAVHAALFMPLLIKGTNRKYIHPINVNKRLPSLKEFCQILFTFSAVTFGWIFFRAENIKSALAYIRSIFTKLEFGFEYISVERYNVELLPLIALFVVLEWFNRTNEHPFTGKYKWPKIILILFMLFILGVYSNHQEFIYFQF